MAPLTQSCTLGIWSPPSSGGTWANCDAFVFVAAMSPCPCGYVRAAVNRMSVQHFCGLDEAGKDLSARAYHRMLKLARTIANLAGEVRYLDALLAEAI